jgi:hypothetical protein
MVTQNTSAEWESGRIEARIGLRMMPTFPRSPLSSVRRVFPSTAGRMAFQAVPSWMISGLSLLSACAVRHPVCFRPSCASWSQRLSRSVSGRRLDCAPPWRSLLLRPKGPSAQVRVIVSRTVITYSAPSVPLAGKTRAKKIGERLCPCWRARRATADVGLTKFIIEFERPPPK